LTLFLRFDYYQIMESKHAIASLGALANETRLSIFRLLVQAGPPGVAAGAIGSALSVPLPTLSFHLKELAHAELVTSRQDGRFVFYSANFEQMAALMTYLTHNCCQGMPQECLSVMETELSRCCPPVSKRKPTTRSRS
jgi:DNA-binding transcriptional ArsR family regulator